MATHDTTTSMTGSSLYNVERAVQLTQGGHPDLPARLTNLRNLRRIDGKNLSMPNSPAKRALLIGIDVYPHLPGDRQLYGCTNDVALLYDLLQHRFGFADQNISCLRNKQATREGILKAFQRLLAAVKVDDIVVVHYSGHGSYMKDNSKGAGWTETIVPYDSGRKASNHPSTDIKDIEISERLLTMLVSKTPFVTLLFDSCHSGSILRDDFGTAVRGIEPDGELRNNRDIESTMKSGWIPQIPGHRGDLLRERYALLAACRADEKASETSINGTSYGAFTYHLCKLIKESHSEEIRTLFQLASANVMAGYLHQHPILEGCSECHNFWHNSFGHSSLLADQGN